MVNKKEDAQREGSAATPVQHKKEMARSTTSVRHDSEISRMD